MVHDNLGWLYGTGAIVFVKGETLLGCEGDILAIVFSVCGGH